jgi:NADPH:quinone reductase-like Zn-dependent oxidoreductase
MKAIVQDRYGPPADVLGIRERTRPDPEADEVLIRVHAAAIHPGDWMVVTGRPYLMRPLFGLPGPRKSTPGFDVAGVVEAVGDAVVELQPGDEVFGQCGGSCAEYVATDPERLAAKPAGLTFADAAACPLSGDAALRALRDAGRTQPGDRILINGASGGVGTFAVQIAKSMGAEVTAVCSTRNVELVRALGADHVVDYTREDFTRGERRYDLVLDNVGNRSMAACRGVVAGSDAGGAGAVRGRAAAGKAVSGARGSGGPAGAEGAARGRSGATGHRPELSAGRRPSGVPVPRRGARPGEGGDRGGGRRGSLRVLGGDRPILPGS